MEEVKIEETNDENRKGNKKLIFVLLFSLALTFIFQLAASFNKELFWGISHYNSRFWFIIYWLFSVAVISLLAIPKINLMVWSILEKVRTKINLKFPQIFPIIAIITFAALFFLFRTKTYLGDNWVAHGIKAMAFSCLGCDLQLGLEKLFFLHAPLASYVNMLIIKSGYFWGSFSPVKMVVLGSILLGIIFVGILLYFSKRIFKNWWERFLFFGIIISGGYVLLFFGYKEIMQYSVPFILLYLLLGILSLKEKINIIWPTLSFSIALLMHLSVIWFFPSLVYVYYVKIKRAERPLPQKEKKQLLFGLLLGLILPIFLLFNFASETYEQYGYNYFDVQTNVVVKDGFVPLSEEKLNGQAYTMFSVKHLIAVLNEHFLIAHVLLLVVIILIFAFWRKILKDRIAIFLTIGYLFFQIYALSYYPAILPAVRDWDLFSYLGIPLAVLAAYLIVSYFSESEAKKVGLILLAAAFLFTAPWIYINSGFNQNVGDGFFRAMFENEGGLFIDKLNFVYSIIPPNQQENIKEVEIFTLGYLKKGKDQKYHLKINQSLFEGQGTKIYSNSSELNIPEQLPYGVLKRLILSLGKAPPAGEFLVVNVITDLASGKFLKLKYGISPYREKVEYTKVMGDIK